MEKPFGNSEVALSSEKQVFEEVLWALETIYERMHPTQTEQEQFKCSLAYQDH